MNKPREMWIKHCDYIPNRIVSSKEEAQCKSGCTHEPIQVVLKTSYDKLAAELAEVKRINIEDCISRGLHEARMKAANEREERIRFLYHWLFMVVGELKVIIENTNHIDDLRQISLEAIKEAEERILKWNMNL